MAGINGEHDGLEDPDSRIRFGTHADPGIVTLGPKDGGPPGYAAYTEKSSMNIKMPFSAAVLAPLDMRLVGFDNRSALRREGEAPFDDLELCFESASPDWRDMVVCVYHLRTSPLLAGHLVEEECGLVDEWTGSLGSNAAGRIMYLMNETFYGEDAVPSGRDPEPCGADMGRLVKRGELIGYSGQVGDNPHVAFRFKVKSEELNPLTLGKLPGYTPQFPPSGDLYLHWVQPARFFYWKCSRPQAEFPPGVLAYPFECGSF